MHHIRIDRLLVLLIMILDKKTKQIAYQSMTTRSNLKELRVWHLAIPALMLGLMLLIRLVKIV